MGKDSKELRQAIRMTGRIMFSYKKVSAVDHALMEADFFKGISPHDRDEKPSMQVYVDTQAALAKLRERDPELGDFLQNLDTKINLLLQKVANEPSPLDALELQPVSISGSGFGFAAKENLAVHEFLEFHSILLPNQIHIFCLGEVVHCEPMEDQGDGKIYRVSARFTLITEEDRERLIQYNFRLQSQALKNRRLEQDRPK